MTGTGSGSTDEPTDGDSVRCWLVERTYDDKGLVRLVYATPDGTRAVTNERSAALLARKPATAAVDVAEKKLDTVDDDATRDRYAAEATRMRDRHSADDEV